MITLPLILGVPNLSSGEAFLRGYYVNGGFLIFQIPDGYTTISISFWVYNPTFFAQAIVKTGGNGRIVYVKKILGDHENTKVYYKNDPNKSLVIKMGEITSQIHLGVYYAKELNVAVSKSSSLDVSDMTEVTIET